MSSPISTHPVVSQEPDLKWLRRATPSYAEVIGRRPRILFLDAYDSFTNNIVALIETSINAEVELIHIDDPRFVERASTALPPDGSEQVDAAKSLKPRPDEFRLFLQSFDAVVAGPGPGNPSKEQDVGLIAALWGLEGADLLPVLGICLGFQSMCLEYGACIQRLQEPRHGIITEVLHNTSSIFKGIGELQSTQYHSLHINIHHPIQEQRGVSRPNQLWNPTARCPLLEPLAWDCSDLTNGAVLMGVKHRDKPFWGVQYHPESICTNEEGAKTVVNWWTEAQSWLTSHPRNSCKENCTKQSFQGRVGSPTLPSMDTVNPNPPEREAHKPPVHVHSDIVHWKLIDSARLKVHDICDLLHIPAGEAILLESATKANGFPLRSDTGRYSIVGCFIPNETLRLCYYQNDQCLEFVSSSGTVVEQEHVSDIWVYLKTFMKNFRSRNGPEALPFWGGLMGFVTYEAGLDTIGVEHTSYRGAKRRPDLCFAVIKRSIVVDHLTRRLYLQTIRVDDVKWIIDVETKLRDVIARNNIEMEDGLWRSTVPPEILPKEALIATGFPADHHAVRSWVSETILKHVLSQATGELVKEHVYLSKVRSCQEAIRAGDSYELCLTGQTVAAIPAWPSNAGVPWNLYRRLMKVNPAPFGAYIRFGQDGHGVDILSSSPERFLSWSRGGICQFRPIKGTVAKEFGLTRRDAEDILNSSKEKAENLMIADLIRHDLHGVVGAGNVRVKQLMSVEEYETVYQLVSVIEGDLNRTGFSDVISHGDKNESPTKAQHSQPSKSEAEARLQSGMDVLAASLPPGSMTGAPKRRSCEILRDVEQQPRGIYSGVLGYLDVGGGGDFSVVIRTVVHWDDDVSTDADRHGSGKVYDVWRIGAGGAVTAQSTPQGEYDEMVAKRNATLQMFATPNPPREPQIRKRSPRARDGGERLTDHGSESDDDGLWADLAERMQHDEGDGDEEYFDDMEFDEHYDEDGDGDGDGQDDGGQHDAELESGEIESMNDIEDGEGREDEGGLHGE